MSSNDEISPVKTKVTYAVQVEGLGGPIAVTCDDIVAETNYVRFMEGEIPVAVIPAHRLVAASRAAATS